MTLSNIEPLARAIAERIYRKAETSNQRIATEEVAAWVEAHWRCAAADLEAGVQDDDGNQIPGASWELGLTAYRERMAAESHIADTSARVDRPPS